jgi:hypothetical protein
VRRALLLPLLVLATLGCSTTPTVHHQTFAKTDGALASVAIVPFFAHERLALSLDPGGVSAGEAAGLMSRFVSEAFEERSPQVIAASDVGRVFESTGTVVARGDARAAARMAAEKFGATAVVLGELLRYRERVGSARGVTRPASVAFQLTLYTAPDALRVWTARFDRTQQSITGNPVAAREYPGYGSRWLTAAELARFGAGKALESIPASVR